MTDKEILLELIFIEHPDIWALRDVFDYEDGTFYVQDGFSYVNKLLNKRKRKLIKYVREINPSVREIKIKTNR